MDGAEYYSKNAAAYFEQTVELDLREWWEHFTALLPEGGSILDLGCGSGRDSAYFTSRGFDVTAMDASEEMCNLASIHIGQEVLKLSFAEIDFREVFDGIWACASLLHVPGDEIEDIFTKVVDSLKRNGVLYMSFHYGEEEGERGGRYYKNYRTKTLKELIGRHEELEIIELDKCEDVRTGVDTKWVYALVRKV